MAKEAKLVKLSDSLGFNVQGVKTRRKKILKWSRLPNSEEEKGGSILRKQPDLKNHII
jgi:hypothetical protein